MGAHTATHMRVCEQASSPVKRQIFIEAILNRVVRYTLVNVDHHCSRWHIPAPLPLAPPCSPSTGTAPLAPTTRTHLRMPISRAVERGCVCCRRKGGRAVRAAGVDGGAGDSVWRGWRHDSHAS